jgi:hypothetical protein
MSIRSVALLVAFSLLVPQVGAQPHGQKNKDDDSQRSYGQTVANFASGILQMYSSLVAKGNDVWDSLATTQAKSVLDGIAHDAADQARNNDRLLLDMKESIRKETTKDLAVSFRVAQLQNSLGVLGEKLDRFSVEVDKAAHPIGEQARVKFAVAQAGKGAELDAIVRSWQAGRFDEAMEHLKKAQEYLDVMRKLVTCLQDSVKDKKPACDPNQFPMPEDNKKQAAETRAHRATRV